MAGTQYHIGCVFHFLIMMQTSLKPRLNWSLQLQPIQPSIRHAKYILIQNSEWKIVRGKWTLIKIAVSPLLKIKAYLNPAVVILTPLSTFSKADCWFFCTWVMQLHKLYRWKSWQEIHIEIHNNQQQAGVYLQNHFSMKLPSTVIHVYLVQDLGAFCGDRKVVTKQAVTLSQISFWCILCHHWFMCCHCSRWCTFNKMNVGGGGSTCNSWGHLW